MQVYLHVLITTRFRNVSGIVYTHKRIEVDQLVHKMKEKGNISVAGYHSKISLQKREETLRKWLSGDTLVIFATVAFGMGIPLL